MNGLQPSGKADFRVRGAGSRQLNVEIRRRQPAWLGRRHVFVGNQHIGTITVGPPPCAEAARTQHQRRRHHAAIRPGDQITIRTAARGVLVTGVVRHFSFSEVPP
ncbi:MAG: hypothetical protein IPJ98_12665, partial [Bryobacterales bacterium]|nr:hypothetical protein [Bryobacterales bacterium]